MCVVCTRRLERCDHLPFESMKPIATYDNIKVVKCTEWIRDESIDEFGNPV